MVADPVQKHMPRTATVTPRRVPSGPPGNGTDAGGGIGRHRLGAVDGLRAFAALWVVLFHVRAFSGARLPLGLDTFVRSGSTGVSLFLVLSGFCLYVPFAAGGTGRFRTIGFLRRRCRRLMPAYYASLALLFLLYVLAAGHAGIPHWSPGQLASQAAAHVSLTHQLFPSTFYGLNGAYWSLGLEWEFYLTLPLLILAVRRYGPYRTVAGVVAVNVIYRLVLALAVGAGVVAGRTTLATDVLPNLFVGRWGEFALGMLAAELYRSGRTNGFVRRWWWTAIPSAIIGFASAGNPVAHLFFGYLFFVLLSAVLVSGNPVQKVFAWRPLVLVGVMSYSVYLVHQPLIEIEAALLGHHVGSSTSMFLVLLLSIPAFLAVAAILFFTVERRTLHSAAQPRRQGSLPSPRSLSLAAARIFAPRRRLRPAVPVAVGPDGGAP